MPQRTMEGWRQCPDGLLVQAAQRSRRRRYVTRVAYRLLILGGGLVAISFAVSHGLP